MEATTSVGHEVGTDGTSISCLVFLGAPVMSLVATLTEIPPSTPRSSEIAPRIKSFTGVILDFAMAKSNAVRRGMVELWHPESAIVDNSAEVGFDVLNGCPCCSWPSSKGVSSTLMIGLVLEALTTHLPSNTWCYTGFLINQFLFVVFNSTKLFVKCCGLIFGLQGLTMLLLSTARSLLTFRALSRIFVTMSILVA